MSEDIKLQLKRTIKAQRKQVFDAWTKPELMRQWFAPGDMTVPSVMADPCVGGSFEIVMLGEMDGATAQHTVTGIYKTIIPNELICFTWSWKADPSPHTLVTVAFKDVPGGTEVTLTHERFASTEAKDKHQHGWLGCLDNLAKIFAQ